MVFQAYQVSLVCLSHHRRHVQQVDHPASAVSVVVAVLRSAAAVPLDDQHARRVAVVSPVVQHAPLAVAVAVPAAVVVHAVVGPQPRVVAAPEPPAVVALAVAAPEPPAVVALAVAAHVAAAVVAEHVAPAAPVALLAALAVAEPVDLVRVPRLVVLPDAAQVAPVVAAPVGLAHAAVPDALLVHLAAEPVAPHAQPVAVAVLVAPRAGLAPVVAAADVRLDHDRAQVEPVALLVNSQLAANSQVVRVQQAVRFH